MQLVALRHGIATGIAADTRFSGVMVYEHGGDFDLAELKRYAKQTPAVIVHVLRADMEAAGGLPTANVTCAAIILAEDKPGATGAKDVLALELTDKLLRLLQTFPGPGWGLDTSTAIRSPDSIVARNLYSRELDEKGVAMWVVAWRQLIDLTEDSDTSVPFDRVDAVWDLAPRDNGAALGDIPEAEDDIELDPGP